MMDSFQSIFFLGKKKVVFLFASFFGKIETEEKKKKIYPQPSVL